MVERRTMIAGGLLAGLVGAIMPSAAQADAGTHAGGGAAAAPAPGAPAGGGGALAGGGAALDENTPIFKRMLDELELHRPTGGTAYNSAVDAIRRQQRLFLKARGVYPEFVEVGLDIWDQIYDWHVRYQMPVKISRLPDGFYGMPFYLTTLVLKPNMVESYVGPGRDTL